MVDSLSVERKPRASTELASQQWLRALCVSAVVLTVGHLVATSAIAESIRIEVDDEQRVTIVGEASSLRMVITDLCIRAGVELGSYDAADRSIRANYESLPLREVLPRLLRQESHTLRLRGKGDQLRVARLEVIGTKSSNRPNRTRTWRATDAGNRLWLPPSLMEAAFASPDASRRAEAVLAIGEYIVGDTQRYIQFLEADPEWMARAIQSYPHARAMLARLRDDQGDNAVARKVTVIIVALDNLPPPPADTLRERIFLSRSSP